MGTPQKYFHKNDPSPLIRDDRRYLVYMGGKNGPLNEAEQNRLIVDCIEIIAPVAQKYRGGKVPFEDLCAAGREGLTVAARTFDPARGEFLARAVAMIDAYIGHCIRSYSSQWVPKEMDGPLSPLEGDKIEKIYEWDAWGIIGNAMAISESWTTAGATPEDIAIAFDDVRDKRERFASAFLSLSSIERKMVRAVFLTDPPSSIENAARDIGISRWRASRSLKKALLVMREVIARIEKNEKERADCAA